MFGLIVDNFVFKVLVPLMVSLLSPHVIIQFRAFNQSTVFVMGNWSVSRKKNNSKKAWIRIFNRWLGETPQWEMEQINEKKNIREICCNDLLPQISRKNQLLNIESNPPFPGACVPR